MILRLGIPLTIAALLALIVALTIDHRVWPFVFGGVVVYLLRQRN